VAKIVISPLDSRRLFAASVKDNIYSFSSTSATDPNNPKALEQNFLVTGWTDLSSLLSAHYSLGADFKDIIINPQDGVMYLATGNLILRSSDGGATWENVKLLPTAKDAVINALAVNPQNSADIYYVTNTAFFHSEDSGVTWQTKNLPTQRAGRALLIDFKNPGNLYLGTVKLKS